jgi:hypothetical protein
MVPDLITSAHNVEPERPAGASSCDIGWPRGFTGARRESLGAEPPLGPIATPAPRDCRARQGGSSVVALRAILGVTLSRTDIAARPESPANYPWGERAEVCWPLRRLRRAAGRLDSCGCARPKPLDGHRLSHKRRTRNALCYNAFRAVECRWHCSTFDPCALRFAVVYVGGGCHVFSVVAEGRTKL